MKQHDLEAGIVIISKIEAAEKDLARISGHGVLEVSCGTVSLEQISPAAKAMISANIINDLKLTIETLKAELEAL